MPIWIPVDFMKRLRADQALFDRGLVESREQAKKLIMAGSVRINGTPLNKAGSQISPDDILEIDAPPRYVSRGGEKLQHALDHFEVRPEGWFCLDLGSSTGGFTDCLLQSGAARVHAVDVGTNQLAWKLRNDARVVVMEQTNARQLGPSDMAGEFQPADLTVIDCSFISLRLILPAAQRLTRPGGRIIALIKPQFEAGKEEVDRGKGVIRDPSIHERVLGELRSFAQVNLGMHWTGHTPSPILGPAGNREFLALLSLPACTESVEESAGSTRISSAPA